MFNKSIFKKNLLEFLNDAIILCEKNADKLTIGNIKWPIFFPNGKYKKYEIRESPDYDFFIKNTIKDEISQLQTYSIIIKFFVTQEIQNYNKKLLGDLHENFKTKPNFARDLPLKFLIRYIELNNKFTLSKTTFDNVYNSFILFLENILEDEYITPIFNFESDIDKKGILIDDLRIRILKSSDKIQKNAKVLSVGPRTEGEGRN